MGYESRVYVDERFTGCEWSGHPSIFREWAAFDLCKMGNNGRTYFNDCFKTEADFGIIVHGSEQEITEDMYGSHIKYCSVRDILEWMDKDESGDIANYRRAKTFRAFLEALPDELKNDTSGAFICVHFGY